MMNDIKTEARPALHRGALSLAAATVLAFGVGTLGLPANAAPPSVKTIKTPALKTPLLKVADKKEPLPDLVARLLPAVVSIAVTHGARRGNVSGRSRTPEGSPFERHFRDYFDRRRPNLRRGRAVGSGFIISSDGYIVTNNHVVKNASQVQIIMTDGRKLDAKVIGTDPRADLALLKVNSPKPLPHVKWGDSSKMRIGESVVAIGNPFGLGGTVTTGIISARKRYLRNFGGMPGSSFVDFLQTDAAINKGNSGGPLFNMQGEVIGINTAIYSRQGTNVGIAFSVPSNLAEPILQQLKKYGRTRRGWLGVHIQGVTEDMAKSLNLPAAKGALVANVVASGPAAKAGVLRGDVIIRFDGKVVTDQNRLPQIVAATDVGKTVKMVVIRKGREKVLEVKLGELEKAQQTGLVKTPTQQSTVTKGALGLRFSALTPQIKQRYKLDNVKSGVVVTSVNPQSQAAEEGLRPGDVIAEVDLVEVKSPKDVIDRINKARSNKKRAVMLMIVRGENRQYVALRLNQGRQR